MEEPRILHLQPLFLIPLHVIPPSCHALAFPDVTCCCCVPTLQDYTLAPLEDDCKLLGSMLDECLRSEVGEELYQKVWDHNAWGIAHGLLAVCSCNDHCCCDRRELRTHMHISSIRMDHTLLLCVPCSVRRLVTSPLCAKHPH